MTALSSIVLRDTAANRPSASIAGRLFYDTTWKRLQRDNGSSWDDVYESILDYVEFTSSVSITATSEATANTVVTGSAFTFDGSTPVWIEAFFPSILTPASSAASSRVYLYDGSSSIGRLATFTNTTQTAAQRWGGIYLVRKLTPSNAAHTYSIRADVTTGSGTVEAGAGGNAAVMPGFIRTRIY